MDKRSLAILLLASSVASSAFATRFVDKLIPNKHSIIPSITKTHKTTKQSDGTYIDFSGSWVGKCGDGQDISTVIENGADFIILDGEESRIGRGLEGTYRSNEEVSDYNHTSFEWAQDGSSLIMKEVNVNKYNTDNSAIQTILSTFSLTMKNGQINFDGKLAGFQDLTQITEFPMTVHCVFSKKQ